MSLSWLDGARYRLHLGSGHVVACELRGMVRPYRCVRMALFPFEANGRIVALQALSDWMAQGVRRAAAATQVWTLGICDVRYLHCDASAACVGAPVRQRVLRSLFEQQFHQSAEAWQMRVCNASYGGNALAAFVEQSLLADIRSHARASRVRLVRVEPSVCAVWNRFETRLARTGGALHVIEGARQLVLRHEGTQILGVAFRPFGACDADFEAEPKGDASAAVFADRALAEHARRAVLQLANAPGFRADHDALYAPALCRDY